MTSINRFQRLLMGEVIRDDVYQMAACKRYILVLLFDAAGEIAKRTRFYARTYGGLYEAYRAASASIAGWNRRLTSKKHVVPKVVERSRGVQGDMVTWREQWKRKGSRSDSSPLPTTSEGHLRQNSKVV